MSRASATHHGVFRAGRKVAFGLALLVGGAAGLVGEADGGAWTANGGSAALFSWIEGTARAADDPDTEIAKRHFQKGLASYNAGQYEVALREFQEAKLARPLPALEFNIAKCLDRLERYSEAIEAYQRYAVATPDAAEVVEARSRARILRSRLDAKKVLDAAPSTAMATQPAAAPPAEKLPPAAIGAPADNAARARALVDEGIARFGAGDLPAARVAFARAGELAPEQANPNRWLGLTDARLGRCDLAAAEFDRFLALVPATDPRDAEAITLRDRCREELSPKRGTLVIESTPPGAEVRLDDAAAAPVGLTPYSNAAVSVGSHVVFVGKKGYAGYAKGVTVGAHETLRLEVTLLPPAEVHAAPVVDAAAESARLERVAASVAEAKERRRVAEERALAERLEEARQQGLWARGLGRAGLVAGFVALTAFVPMMVWAFNSRSQINGAASAAGDGQWTTGLDQVAGDERTASYAASTLLVGSVVLIAAGSIALGVGQRRRDRAEEKARVPRLGLLPLVSPSSVGLNAEARF